MLTAIYAAYLAVLGKMPPQEEEGIEDLERIPRAIVLSPRARRIALIGGLFVAGGLLIYLGAEPFLGSLFAISTRLGIPTFIFVQWVAPFVSEFPEGLSTFYWARTVHRAPMALMNLVSSNINQWTLLVAMLPVVLSLSLRSILPRFHWTAAGHRSADDHRPATGGHAVPGEHGAGVVGSIRAIRIVVRAVFLFSHQAGSAFLGRGGSACPLVDHHQLFRLGGVGIAAAVAGTKEAAGVHGIREDVARARAGVG